MMSETAGRPLANAMPNFPSVFFVSFLLLTQSAGVRATSSKCNGGLPCGTPLEESAIPAAVRDESVLSSTYAPTLLASITDTSTNAILECVVETTACTADATCEECRTIADEVAENGTYAECRESYQDLSGSTLSTCEFIGSVYCCSNYLSENDCLANDASSAYWNCVIEDNGCSRDDFACVAEAAHRSDDDVLSGREVGSGGVLSLAPWAAFVCITTIIGLISAGRVVAS